MVARKLGMSKNRGFRQKKAPKRDIQTRFVRLLQQKQRYLRGLSKYNIIEFYKFVKSTVKEFGIQESTNYANVVPTVRRG